MDKYKELYDLSKEMLQAEQGRFNRVDQKASMYLGALTVLLGITGYFVKWVSENIVPPSGLLQWTLLAQTALALLLMLGAWFAVLLVLKMSGTHKTRLDESMLRFFKDHRQVDVYWGMARRVTKGYRLNIAVTDSKIRRLTWAYRFLVVLVVILASLAITLVLYGWLGNCLTEV